MPDPHRLRRSADIRAVLAARTTVHGRCASLAIRDRGDGGPWRAAVVAGRRVGGAVERNRAKRRLRAQLRMAGLPDGADVVAIARARAVDAPAGELSREVRRLVSRACGSAS